MRLTLHLLQQPFGHTDFGEVLQDGALHCQFVQIRIEKGGDPFWDWRFSHDALEIS